MKTPEQLAEEYATPKFETYDPMKGYQKAERNAFLAGYAAGYDACMATYEAIIEKMNKRGSCNENT